MSILTISGSIRKESTTVEFLKIIASSIPNLDFQECPLDNIPLFHPDAYDAEIPDEVISFKSKIKKSKAIIIATPEYIHNIPAVLKNTLEWTTQTGEMVGKKTLAITYTPHPPRGEKAMISLLSSLQALDADVVASMDFYHDAVQDSKLSVEAEEMLTEAINLLR